MTPDKTPPCPNESSHTPHPAGYIAHSNWAEHAAIVADQKQCAGCGLWAIWTPKRRDLRIAMDGPPGSCDWGGCDAEGVAERFDPKSRGWLPVCAHHAGIKPRRPSPDRADCPECGQPNITLTGKGELRAHDRPGQFAVRCSGKKPAEASR